MQERSACVPHLLHAGYPAVLDNTRPSEVIHVVGHRSYFYARVWENFNGLLMAAAEVKVEFLCRLCVNARADEFPPIS